MVACPSILPRRLNPVNVATVPQRSPFRYPGGKTWLVPFVRRWIASLHYKPAVFVEPFLGGGIVGLTVAAENLADTVVLGELDHEVGAVWHTILGGGAEWLAQRILEFEMTRGNVVRALRQEPRSRRDLAFQTLLRNRVQRGGILAPGASLVRNGENGRGVLSRWYPDTLARRIRCIAALAERIEFNEVDAADLIKRFRRRKTVAFFVDPPYTAAGKRAGRRLYRHNDVDHHQLFRTMAKTSGAVMMTYDETSEIRTLAKTFGLRVEAVPMKNTHHAVVRELVITNSGSCLDPALPLFRTSIS